MAHDLEKKWRSQDVQLLENVDFSAMLLSNRVLTGLTKAGFKRPSPIQLEAIPIAKIGKDLLVQAKSGTGKTLVFVITALEMLRRRLFRPQVLILVPTREIATQICSVVKSVGSAFPKLTCCSFIGGLSVSDDKDNALACQIVVGTPGRLKQLIAQNSLPVNAIRLLVFDEADQLLQMSFKQDIEDIFKFLPNDKQVIATSATYPSTIRKNLIKYLREPHLACLNSRELALLGIVHYAKVVKGSPMALLFYKIKLSALEEILKTVKFSQSLVFCNGIQRVEVLYRDIKKWGFSATYISSAKEQNDRLKAIDRLKHFKCKVLVSSDVTARGIDAENVDLVINFDFPFCTETYMHRVGRSGRFGSVGVAISIIEEKEVFYLAKREKEGCFKTYKLPDPVPVDLIQKARFEEGEYVIESDVTSSSDTDKKSAALDKAKTDASDDNENDITHTENIEKELEHVHNPSSDEGDYVLTEQTREEEILDICTVTSSSFVKNANGDMADSDISCLENIDCNEKKHFDGNDLKISSNIQTNKDCDESLNVRFSNFSIESLPQSHISIINNAKKSDVNSEVKSDREPVDNIENKNVNHCLDKNEVKDYDSKSRDLNPNECNFQSFENENINSIQDDGSDNRNLSDGLSRNELKSAISSFVDQYETSRRIKSSVLGNRDELMVEESSKKGIISPSAINDLNTKKFDYFYKVFKKFQESNEHQTVENKIEQVNEILTNSSQKETVEQSTASLKATGKDVYVQSVQNNSNVSDSDSKQNHATLIEDCKPLISQEFMCKSNFESTPQLPTESKQDSIFKSELELAIQKKQLYIFNDTSDELDSEDMENDVDLDMSQNSSEMSSRDSESSGDSKSSMSSRDSESSADSKSSGDSEEGSSFSSVSDSCSSDDLTSENSYHHNYHRSGKQNPSLVSSSSENMTDLQRKSHSRNAKEHHESFKNSYPTCLKSHCQLNHCLSLENYPRCPSSCSRSKRYQGRSNIRNYSLQSECSRQKLTTCSRSCLQPSEHMIDSKRKSHSKNTKEHHEDFKNSHPSCLKSHQLNHCLSLENYPHCPSSCSGNERYLRRNNVRNYSLQSVCSRQKLTACSSSCFQPSEHRCHDSNNSLCGQMSVCSMWYRTFYNQWRHVQSYVNSALM